MNERSIFMNAAEIPDPDERASYLDEACKDDPQLRVRVEALLAAHAATDGFMTRPAAERDPGATLSELRGPDGAPTPAGAVLADRYVLGPEIGRGGMGTVYRAEQVRPVRRTVAVKLINPGMGSGRILSRFEAERQALALMDHPNIARVLDAGATPEGRPFFVMELVDGVPLTAYCDEHRLTVSERLRLFGRICRAVQHAHRRGIIHRDLKPSNILVEDHGGDPTPKIIDFGLAKAVGETALTDQATVTVPGAFAGSPLYMAPEQAGPEARDVDVRADVYALGAILYELLTGSTPIPRDDLGRIALAEVVRLVREEEPAAPSRRLGGADSLPSMAAARAAEPGRLCRLIRGDLDRVAMKALEKDRERRYESASAFADDVERFLNHEPVSAGPPTAWYRIRKFIRKNRTAVVAASLVLLAMLAGIIGTSLGFVRAAAERDRAVRATDRASRALETLTDDALEGLLGRREAWGDRERAFLGRIRDQLESLASAEGEADATGRMRASVRLRLGSIRALFGDTKAAEEDYRAAIAEYERLPDPSSRGDAAQAARRLGGLLATTGQAAAAQREFGRAARAYDLLAAEFPKDASFRLGAALARNDSGFVHFESGELDAAEIDCRRAADDLGKLDAEEPADPTFATERARAMHNLYMVLSRGGRSAEAERILEKAVDRLRAADVRHRDPRVKLALGKALQSRVAVLSARGDLAGAEPLQRETIAIHAALAAGYPATPDHRRELARGQLNLGVLYGRLGRHEPAIRAYREAVTAASRLAEDFPVIPAYRSQLAHVRLALGEELAAGEKHEEAEATLAEALPLWESLRGEAPGSPTYAAGLTATLARLGATAEARKQMSRALGYLERADRIRNEVPELLCRDPMGPPAIHALVASLAQVRLAMGDHAGAASAADELARIEVPDGAINAYNAGCYLARCSALAATDPALPPDRRTKQVEDHAARAVTHLRTAFSRGFDDAALLAGDADLAPLRARPDFKAILPRRK